MAINSGCSDFNNCHKLSNVYLVTCLLPRPLLQPQSSSMECLVQKWTILEARNVGPQNKYFREGPLIAISLDWGYGDRVVPLTHFLGRPNSPEYPSPRWPLPTEMGIARKRFRTAGSLEMAPSARVFWTGFIETHLEVTLENSLSSSW